MNRELNSLKIIKLEEKNLITNKINKLKFPKKMFGI